MTKEPRCSGETLHGEPFGGVERVTGVRGLSGNSGATSPLSPRSGLLHRVQWGMVPDQHKTPPGPAVL